MLRTHRFQALALGCAVIFSLGSARVAAQEHPEHPEESAGSGTEKPSNSAKPPVTKETLATAIQEWVTKDSHLKGGYFCVFDSEKHTPLALQLVKVHNDKLANLSPTLHFACADFKATSGTVYDLDVFMEGDTPEALHVTEVSVHKEAGKPRYVWQEKGGLWTRKPLSSAYDSK